MLRYETLFLVVPEITKDESDSIEKDFAKLVKDNSAQLISYERWGKYRLAYPVRKNEYGVYFLTRFEYDGPKAEQFLNEVRTFFKVKRHELVMRFLTTSLDSKKSLAYQHPQSLEEAPTRTRDTMQYLKDARAISVEGDRGHGPVGVDADLHETAEL